MSENNTFRMNNLTLDFDSIKVVAYACLTLFVITSLTDVFTTYVGLTSGFAEQTEFVDFLWINYGFMGLIASKFISIGAITAIASPFYLFDRKWFLMFLSVLYLMGTMVFGYATFHNLVLLGYI